jgi:4-hydroxy-3-methylbut-2-enyl diphosphate reductase
VQLAAGPEQIDWSLLQGRQRVGVTAAASTPENVVQAILEALGQRFSVSVAEAAAAVDETVSFKPLKVA